MQIVLQTLPKTALELESMPEIDLTSPFHVAALFIAAICVYSENKNECFRMVDVLKGPQKLSAMEKQFIHTRMMGKASYIGKSYFAGATPENDYTPILPHTVSYLGDPKVYGSDSGIKFPWFIAVPESLAGVSPFITSSIYLISPLMFEDLIEGLTE